MLSVRLLPMKDISKVWGGGQKLYTDFQLHRGWGSKLCIIRGLTVYVHKRSPTASPTTGSVSPQQSLNYPISPPKPSQNKKTLAKPRSALFILVRHQHQNIISSLPSFHPFSPNTLQSNYILSMVFKTVENV